jgi:hypothetical protein
MPLVATRGAASAQGFGEFAQQTAATYIEDVFSTWLYTGNGSTQTITNGIDLASNNGLIWIKSRNNSTFANSPNVLTDSVTGFSKYLISSQTSQQQNWATDAPVPKSYGFDLPINGLVPYTNYLTGSTYVAWTFRKQPKFFDVVTWTGTGSGTRNIAHDLASTPGAMFIKQTSSNTVWVNWYVYHRANTGTPETAALFLNLTDGTAQPNTYLASTAPTSTQFTVQSGLNESGKTYVAYLFAHNAGGFGLTGTDNVISCGSVVSTGGNVDVSLGYEPQWLLMKNASNIDSWYLYDTMRGMSLTNDFYLFPNRSDAEGNFGASYVNPTATGFRWNSGAFGAAGETYIYIAIRRGPMKTPTTGTSVFSPVTNTGNGTAGTILTAGVPVDLDFGMVRSSAGLAFSTFVDRLRGATRNLYGGSTAAESADTTGVTGFDNQTGVIVGTGSNNSWPNQSPWTYISWMLRRAPGFFDEVCWTGTGSYPLTINHNLGVAPELMIFKARSAADGWYTYAAPLTSPNANWYQNYVVLNNSNASASDLTSITTAPTSTAITISSYYSANGRTYVAYLFASVAGVSKVGSYTGTGASQTINCGFTGGARFVLIKRADSAGNWFVYDSARGITSGNDPYLLLNLSAAEVTGTNYVDTTSVGFQVTAAAPAGLNANGGTYIFLAVA